MSRSKWIAAGILLAGAVGVLALYRASGSIGRGVTTKVAADARKAIASDEERRAYILKHVTLHGLTVAPDEKPGPDGGVRPVAGLLRVTGVVENTGDRSVDEVVLIVHPQDETNGVLGTYSEDVVGGHALSPGEKRSFTFKIRDDKRFAGRFLHSLR